jgi:ribonuclease HI
MKKKYYIFTDGSHLKGQGGSGRLGCGGVLVDPEGGGLFGKELSRFSLEITPEYMELTYGSSDISNPTAEMFGVLSALKEFKKYLKSGIEITVFADYQGVREWLTGKWKINKKYIQGIRDDIMEEIKRGDLDVTFEWIPGHQSGRDNFWKHWNDVVDLLAKGK